jgi:methionyl-tRNA synthetase
MGLPADARSFAGLTSGWYAALCASGFVVGAPQPLFPRLELPAEAQ